MMNRMARAKVVAGLLTFAAVITSGGPGQAQEDWRYGADLGFMTNTVNDTVFALGFNADYFVTNNFSIGPMLLVAPAGSLTQFGAAGVARIHLKTEYINLVPFAGVGFVYANLGAGSNNPTSTNATSQYFPLGLTIEYQLRENLALTTTLMVNIYNLEFGPAGTDQKSGAVMFGVRFGP